ncbi:MAG: hypothetical protein IJW92_05235 [Clostridia bacterium]|nr:hypothetical protein [Clostridia bacterium]
MTISDSCVPLWDNGTQKLYAVAVSPDGQYRYYDGIPCITIGFLYEDAFFKGYDSFTFFDTHYTKLISTIKATYQSLNGHIRLYDVGGDTDGYIEIDASDGKLSIHGQLGASFSQFSLKFSLDADQTLLNALLSCIKIKNASLVGGLDNVVKCFGSHTNG